MVSTEACTANIDPRLFQAAGRLGADCRRLIGTFAAGFAPALFFTSTGGSSDLKRPRADSMNCLGLASPPIKRWIR